jgi:hypothetical protein
MSSRIASLDLSDSSDDDSDVVSVTGPPPTDTTGTFAPADLTSPLFGTPRSTLSEGTTGGVKAQVQLFLCKRAISVCRGYVTNDEGIRFCCKDALDCTIMKHQVTKANLRDGFLYVKAPRADQGAYLEPSLALTKVPEIERLNVQSFLDRKNLRPLWLAFFQACERAATTTASLNQDPDLSSSSARQTVATPRLESYTQAEANLQTPRGLRINTFASDDTPFESVGDASPGATVEEMLDLNTNFLSESSGNDTTELAFLEILQEEWPKIRNNFGALSRNLVTMGQDAKVFRTDVRSGFQDVNEFIEEMGIQLQLINTRLGEDGPASDYANCTIWEALEKLQNMATRVSHKVEGFDGQIESLEDLFASHNGSMATVKRSVDKQEEQYELLNVDFDAFLKKFKRQAQKLKRVEEQVHENSKRAAPTPSPSRRTRFRRTSLDDDDENSPTNSESELRAFRAQLKDLERKVEHVAVTGSGDSQLEERVKALETKIGGEAFVMHDRNFGSLYELELWVEETEIPSCGLFWDLFSTLVVMNQEKAQTGKARADSTYSSTRIKSTRLENNLVAAMGHDWPACFFSATTDDQVATKEEGFSTCKSFAQWIGAGGRKAYKDILGERLKHFISGIKGVLDRIPGKPEWVRDARLLLDNIVSQFGALCTFIESFYQSLTSVSKFPTGRAWSLVGRCVGSIFELQVKHRSQSALLEETETLSNKAAVIGSVLKCHQVIDEFISVNFSAHPELVKEMSLFMLTERVDPDEVQTLKTLVGTMKTDVATAKKDAEALKVKHDDVNKRLGDLIAAFATYKTEQKKAPKK